jgi:pantoate--beta-alanine ligase
MITIRKRADLRAVTAQWRERGDTIGVVPTMGALHAGHLSLVSAAKAQSDRVIVTLFVNPRQFDNPEDLANYPRTEISDAAKLDPFDVDVLYIPDPDQIYPDGFATTVSVSGISEILCGAARPGHFDGVATVVSKLFLQSDADMAFFGEKDFQQVQVVRRVARDLDLKTRIVPCATVREPDGLALSSRNMRLDEQTRKTAPLIYRALTDVARSVRNGAQISTALDAAKTAMLDAGIGPIDYLELRHQDDLTLANNPSRPSRVFVAAWLGPVRLIDNIAV